MSIFPFFMNLFSVRGGDRGGGVETFNTPVVVRWFELHGWVLDYEHKIKNKEQNCKKLQKIQNEA